LFRRSWSALSPRRETQGMRRKDLVAGLRIGLTLSLSSLLLAGRPATAAETRGSISGTVRDPLGTRGAGAAVRLVRHGTSVAVATSDEQGRFSFSGLEAARYQLEVRSSGWEPQTPRSVFLGTDGRVEVDVTLQLGLKQDLVVTASATEESPAQVGAPVT